MKSIDVESPIETDANLRAKTKARFSVSVRELISFVLQSGDLGGSGRFSSPLRALAGTRGHQRLQRDRPSGYETEVVVSHQIETPDFVLVVKGRIDGVLRNPTSLLVEEIKTVSGTWDGVPDPLHWAQAKIYAFIHGEEKGFGQVEVQLTYLDLDSGRTTEIREIIAMEDLRVFAEQVTSVYLEWVGDHHRWREFRDESIKGVLFPFAGYRKGQRALSVAVYRAIAASAKLFAEAPTGIGKTISVLFPAIKALGEGHLEKIFYLTAKTIGRTVAEKSVEDLRNAGLRLRRLTITARDKTCFNNGEPCDVKTCIYAIGYYDRVKEAVREALKHDGISRDVIEDIARKHQVCPFELSLDISLWVDAIICDYNYVFDPSVYLKRYFSEEQRDFAFLVDEAHNLVERAREMFSADLEKREIMSVESALKENLPGCAKILRKIRRGLAKLASGEERTESEGPLVINDFPEELGEWLRDFLKEAEIWLAQNKPALFRQELLDLYFRAARFLRTADACDHRYATIVEPNGARINLYCIDPSASIQQALGRGKSAIFFSATLRPMDYFRDTLGGGETDALLQLDSPFARENLAVLVEDRIATHYRARGRTVDAVVNSIAAVVQGKKGNYLAYFPSYQYLNEVLARFQVLHPEMPTLAQTPGMKESQREEFIAQFHAEHEAGLVGFGVLGGIFGEGIDLVGERLVGAVIVGVGLPQICLERNLIRNYYQEIKEAGFAYAYTYPGINRVLQAAGRVIRSEVDRGVVLLIDERFGREEYRSLLPMWWMVDEVRGPEEVLERVRRFWGETG